MTDRAYTRADLDRMRKAIALEVLADERERMGNASLPESYINRAEVEVRLQSAIIANLDPAEFKVDE